MLSLKHEDRYLIHALRFFFSSSAIALCEKHNEISVIIYWKSSPTHEALKNQQKPLVLYNVIIWTKTNIKRFYLRWSKITKMK